MVYAWNYPPGTLERIVRILGFEGKLNWNSFSYLETPIFKGKKTSSYWQGIVYEIKKTISSWGVRWLNPASKLVLINSILDA